MQLLIKQLFCLQWAVATFGRHLLPDDTDVNDGRDRQLIALYNSMVMTQTKEQIKIRSEQKKCGGTGVPPGLWGEIALKPLEHEWGI